MTITVSRYNNFIDALFENQFDEQNFIYAAQCLSSGYQFSATHGTRSNIASSLVGSPIVLSNKTITKTIKGFKLSCSNPDFTSQSISAAHCAFFIMNSGPSNFDGKLLFLYTFDGGSSQSVSSPIQLNECGLIAVEDL